MTTPLEKEIETQARRIRMFVQSNIQSDETVLLGIYTALICDLINELPSSNSRWRIAALTVKTIRSNIDP